MMIPNYDYVIYIYIGLLKVPEALGSAERFDPSVKRWTRLPNMLTPRSRCAAVAAKGRLHILGGRSDSRQAAPTERPGLSAPFGGCKAHVFCMFFYVFREVSTLGVVAGRCEELVDHVEDRRSQPCHWLH